MVNSFFSEYRRSGRGMHARRTFFKVMPTRFLSLTPALSISMLISAVMFGLAAAVLPYWLNVVLLSLVFALWLAWSSPDYAVALILLAQSGIVPPQFLPHIPLMGGFIRPDDIFYLFVLLVVLFQLPMRHVDWRALRPYLFALGYLLFLGVASFFYALFYRHTVKGHILAEAEPLLYWGILCVIAIVGDSSAKIRRLAMLMSVLGVLVAASVATQSLTGHQFVYGGRFEAVKTLGQTYSGVLRSITPGIFLLLFGLLHFTARALSRVGSRTINVIFLLVLVLGLIFTFGRTLWAVSAVGIVVVAVQLGKGAFLKLTVAGALGIAVLIVCIATVKPLAFDAIENRALSYGAELHRGESVRWREVENHQAMKVLQHSPWLGVGLGGNYKPHVLPGISNPQQVRYIHNGYLYMALKLGIFSLLFLPWIYFLVFARRAAKIKRLLPIDSAILMSSLALIILPWISSLTRPDWMTPATIAVVATCFGMVIALKNSVRES